MSADAAARVVTKAVTTRRPRTRHTVGRDAAVVTRLTRLRPDRIIAAGLRRHYPQEPAPAPAEALPVAAG